MDTFTFRNETYTRTVIDGRRHNRTCEHCGFDVYRRHSDFACGRKVLHIACGRKVLHTACVAGGCPAPVAPSPATGCCAGCRVPLPATVQAFTFNGLRYCARDCAENHLRGLRYGEVA